MRRRRQRVHVGTTIPLDDHARLLELADELDATIADVLRELIAAAVKSRSKSGRIRHRLLIDVDDESA